MQENTKSPNYWRLDIYKQVASVCVGDWFADVTLHLSIEDQEVVYRGTIHAIAALLKNDCRFLATLSSTQLTIQTYGIPFLVDSPTPDVEITVDITEDFVLVFAPTVAQHKRVHAYHQELIQAIAGEPLHPASTDWQLYPNYKNYYQAVMNQLLPELNCSDLSSRSRHEFFIATEPVQHPKTQQWMMGTSGLAQLMGFSIPDELKEVEVDTKKDDTLLSAVTGALLIFKGRASWVVQNYSLVELSYLLTTASERIRAANAEMDNRFKNESSRVQVPEVKPAPESKKWTAVKEGAIARLTDLNVPLPKFF